MINMNNAIEFIIENRPHLHYAFVLLTILREQ